MVTSTPETSRGRKLQTETAGSSTGDESAAVVLTPERLLELIAENARELEEGSILIYLDPDVRRGVQRRIRLIRAAAECASQQL